jgi:hypothetical protein
LDFEGVVDVDVDVDDDAQEAHRAEPKYKRKGYEVPGPIVDEPATIYLLNNEVKYNTKETCAQRSRWR